MGAAAAKKLADEGFRIAIFSSSGKGQALAESLRGFGVTGSNQSEENLQQLVETTLQRWGRIDVLVNIAGHGPRAPVLELSDAQWQQGMETYFLNVVRALRLITPAMQKQGSVINISSAWTFEQTNLFPTSAVFRAGLAAFTKIYANRYASDNIRINNVLPGWIDSLPATDARRVTIPLQRYGSAEEVAATIAFLASPGAAYITGQNIRIDGGVTRSL